MNTFLKAKLVTTVCLSAYSLCFGQITVTPGLSVSHIVDSLIFNDQGGISNVAFNGSVSAANEQQLSVQAFFCNDTLFPFNQGLFLTTSNAPSVMNDPDLLMIADVPSITSGSIVEFDFVAEEDSMAFKYLFASAEYNGYTCSFFNDAFGFFLSGPGISGPYSNNAINIATIPGSNTPISVNTVNSGIATGGPDSNCLNANPTWQQDTIYFTTSFNQILQSVGIPSGATVVLIAAHNLTVGETYHIKLAVANAMDNALQSSVFIEATFFDVAVEPCQPVAANPDVAIEYGWSTMIAPIEEGTLILNLCNLACENQTDATVTVEFPTGFITNIVGLNNPALNNNNLSFDMNSLQNCETMLIPFSFPGSTLGGTQICLPVNINALNDTELINNLDTICGVVLNSYDPNMKQVNQPTTIHPDKRDRFVYKVDFQNDGNFPAINVVIRDTLSPNLDLSTFKFVGASHDGYHILDTVTREVKFVFHQIGLESSEIDLESSRGYVIFEILEEIGLSEGDAVENTAYIYFDLNPPIITNKTININEYPLDLGAYEESQFIIYPNPSNGDVSFSNTTVHEVIIYDLLGQKVMAKQISSNTLNLNDLNPAVYFVQMYTANGVQMERLVLQR